MSEESFSSFQPVTEMPDTPGGSEVRQRKGFSRDVFIWEDPPGYLRESTYKPALDMLRKRPGQWARIIECWGVHGAHTTAQYLRNAESVKRQGNFEFAARKIADGIGAVYARFVEEASDDESV